MPEPPSDATRLRSGSPHAAAAVWRWREAAGEGAATLRAQRRSSLRREGVLRALVGGAVGGVLVYLGAVVLGRIAWCVAGVVLVAALASPDGVYAAIGRALALLGHGIGRLLAVLFLTPVFWLFFVPFGRLLRSGRRDRLERWFDRAAPSYWHRRDDRPRTKSSYEKAF
jgi:hypothetical protein